MVKSKKWFTLPTSLAAALVLITGLVGSVSAAADPAQLTGDFHTIALSCPPPDDTEQCVIDQLGGDLVGTNKLVTTRFVETNQTIEYFDNSTITITSGTYAGMTFVGEEHGVIDVQTGEFHSTARLISTDGCGSHLINHNSGAIDLNTLEDSGTYQSTIVIQSC